MTNENTQVATTEPDRAIVHDNSQFANLMDTTRFNQMYRVATMFSKSSMIPDHYRNDIGNCFIATQMAVRLEVDPFMFMQNTYIVHGKPGMEAKLAISLINTSGLFTDSLDYEIDGTDPFDNGYRVRCFATRVSTGKIINGPWIDWKIVKAEKWSEKPGSKWKTIPGLMFQYRAATFFGRLHCPERLMGMQTNEELRDIEPGMITVEAIPPEPSGQAKDFSAKLHASAEQADKPKPKKKAPAKKPNVEVAPEPVAEPAPEPEQPQPSSEPSDWDRLVESLAMKCGVVDSAARIKLLKFIETMFGATPATVTPAQMFDMKDKINSGDLKV